MTDMETEFFEAASAYEKRIRKALAVQDAALKLAALPGADVDSSFYTALEEAGDPLTKQLGRLQRGEFRIAVVGLEKAGKSTFVNGWLGYDLLPSKNERCTFSTTELVSVGEGDEQLLEVQVRTKKEFDELQKRLLEQSKSGSDAEKKAAAKDLENIEAAKTTLHELVRKGDIRKSFVELGNIERDLQKYVASVSHAYAVRRVRISTHALRAGRGVVFFDVPGLNAGLATLEEASERMLADADAVILIQDSRRPSIEGSEQKLVRFAKDGDRQVRLADKLFVFLNQADLQGSHADMQNNLKSARAEWRKPESEGGVGLSPDRITMGSAVCHLLNSNGHISEATKTRFGGTAGWSTTRDKLVSVMLGDGVAADANAADANAVEKAAGMAQFRKRVQAFLREDRIRLLRRRCDGPMQRVSQLAQRIKFEVEQRIGTDFLADEEDQASRWRFKFQRWMDQYLQETVMARMSAVVSGLLDDPNRQAPSKDYRERAAKAIEELSARQEERRDLIIADATQPFKDIEGADRAWRTALQEEAAQAIRELGDELGESLFDEASELLDKSKEEIWGDAVVDRYLVDKRDVYRREVKYGVNALLARFAEPLIVSVVKGPRGSTLRHDIVEKNKRELTTLGTYRGAGGEDLLTFVQKTSGGPAPRKGEPQRVTFEDVVKSVEEDLGEAKEYLCDSVYWASGFEEFRAQELRRLSSKFKRGLPEWRAATHNAWERQHPALLDALAGVPELVSEGDGHQAIGAALRKLTIAIDGDLAGEVEQEIPRPSPTDAPLADDSSGAKDSVATTTASA